jgi:hypothetical protein
LIPPPPPLNRLKIVSFKKLMADVFAKVNFSWEKIILKSSENSIRTIEKLQKCIEVLGLAKSCFRAHD